MAFERPIEADRVDDLGFLSSFVRAPLVGSIMWVLGGDMAKKLDEEEHGSSSRLDEDCDGELAAKPFVPEDVGDVVASDVSDSGDSASSVSDNEEREPILERSKSKSEESVACISETEAVGLTRTGNSLNLSKGRKKLSFSDEVPGQSLAEIRYVGEAESVAAPQKVGSSSSLSRTQPMKSAMKKSGSCRSTSAGSKVTPNAASKFVPSGIVGGKGGGVVMPSGGGLALQHGSGSVGSSSGSKNGHVSPQWGWYISTTPPTPEHYYAPGKGKSGKKQAKVAEERLPPSVAEEYPMPVFKNSPTPVFPKGGAKDVFGNDTMGWPSVPM